MKKSKQCWRHGVRLIHVPHHIVDVKEYLESKLKRCGVL